MATGALVLCGALCAAMLPSNYPLGSGLIDFARIPLQGREQWYRDFGGRRVPGIQEFDVFYHRIGPSIDAARQADIILLGPSFMLYAIDPEQIRRFGEKHHLKIYNMAFFGIRSGEFSRAVIQRWSLRPKLWIINVDDSFDHFFSPAAHMWWIGSSEPIPIPPLTYDRLKGWLNVVRQNIRWRWEDVKANYYAGGRAHDQSVYRRIDDGSVYLDNDSRYGATNNPQTIHVVRDQNCHASTQTVTIGQDFLAAIGGRAVLTLIPNSSWCPTQARELGTALDREVIIPSDTKYSTVDGGGHLDRLGAAAFTKMLLKELELSKTFKSFGN